MKGGVEEGAESEEEGLRDLQVEFTTTKDEEVTFDASAVKQLKGERKEVEKLMTKRGGICKGDKSERGYDEVE